MRLSRRDFIQVAAAMGATLAWGGPARGSRTDWREQRDLYPKASRRAIPDPHSVILWTRRPFDGAEAHVLTVEVAEDEAVQPCRSRRHRAGVRRLRLDDARPRRRPQARRASTGTGSPTRTGTAAASAERSPRRRPTIRGRSTSPSSAARTSTKASSTPIAG